MGKDKSITIRTTEADKLLIEKAAEKRGWSVGKLIRWMLRTITAAVVVCGMGCGTPSSGITDIGSILPDMAWLHLMPDFIPGPTCGYPNGQPGEFDIARDNLGQPCCADGGCANLRSVVLGQPLDVICSGATNRPAVVCRWHCGELGEPCCDNPHPCNPFFMRDLDGGAVLFDTVCMFGVGPINTCQRLPTK